MHEHPPGPWDILQYSFDGWLETLDKVPPSFLPTIKTSLPAVNIRLKELIAVQEPDDDGDGDFDDSTAPIKVLAAPKPPKEAYVLSSVAVRMIASDFATHLLTLSS
jgi:hypothetical protein